jgi:hypothetical protein
MSPFRYRDEEPSTGSTVATVLLGAAAGFAVGMFVAQRVGGFRGLASRLRGVVPEESERQFGIATAHTESEDDEIHAHADDADRYDEIEEVDADAPLLEERVLEAFNNDPILAERAVDIGAMGTGIIELAGWVESDEEAEHAMTLARGVPGVTTVVNRLMVDDEEQLLADNARRREEGDPALTDSGWEGQQIGTGKRRQGSSDEADRHADPKPVLEDRWLSEREAIRHAADDVDAISAERRRKTGKKAPKGDSAEPPAS